MGQLKLSFFSFSCMALNMLTPSNRQFTPLNRPFYLHFIFVGYWNLKNTPWYPMKLISWGILRIPHEMRWHTSYNNRKYNRSSNYLTSTSKANFAYRINFSDQSETKNIITNVRYGIVLVADNILDSGRSSTLWWLNFFRLLSLPMCECFTNPKKVSWIIASHAKQRTSLEPFGAYPRRYANVTLLFIEFYYLACVLFWITYFSPSFLSAWASKSDSLFFSNQPWNLNWPKQM